ncbi:Hypothetical_protein [Hexamita inflata]|uniref:Hypothetical_protein n=1 Tax=Hexamita inflata TaxID=28002 RepID=A0AA86QJ06_9EUKA|nr:Hypothetical protein HINF_LOCUS48004 [Hexamita inflata]
MIAFINSVQALQAELQNNVLIILIQDQFQPNTSYVIQNNGMNISLSGKINNTAQMVQICPLQLMHTLAQRRECLDNLDNITMLIEDKFIQINIATKYDIYNNTKIVQTGSTIEFQTQIVNTSFFQQIKAEEIDPSKYFLSLTCSTDSKVTAFAMKNVSFNNDTIQVYFDCASFASHFDHFIKPDALKDNQKMQMMKQLANKLNEECEKQSKVEFLACRMNIQSKSEQTSVLSSGEVEIIRE